MKKLRKTIAREALLEELASLESMLVRELRREQTWSESKAGFVRGELHALRYIMLGLERGYL